MRPKLSAFPKYYLDRIVGDHIMTVFECIEMARSLVEPFAAARIWAPLVASLR